MTKYSVYFEVESDETWDPHASRTFGTVLTLGSALMAVYTLVVPVDAKIKDITPKPPFEPGYFRCSDDIGYHKAGDIVYCHSMPPEGFYEPVSVTPKSLTKPPFGVQ